MIIKPSEGLSTKHVFDIADEMKLPHGNADLVEKALIEGDDKALAANMFNSLEIASISVVDEIKRGDFAILLAIRQTNGHLRVPFEILLRAEELLKIAV